MGLFRDDRNYAKIHLEFDSSKKRQVPCVVEGDEETISAVIGSLIKQLLESDFDSELLKHAIEIALEGKPKVNKKINVKTIKIDDDKAEELEKLLKKLVED